MARRTRWQGQRGRHRPGEADTGPIGYVVEGSLRLLNRPADVLKVNVPQGAPEPTIGLVTVTLGDRHWSDGKPITSTDVKFWFDLIKANKAQWAGYNPGKAPDNSCSRRAV